MPVHHSRQFNRLRNLAADVRVEAIQQAVANCQPAGRARLHVKRGDYAWPRHYVTLLDELKLHGVPDSEILAVGRAMLDAAENTVYVGNAEPVEPAGDVLAAEALADGIADAAKAQLVDAPHCASTKRKALTLITDHITLLERVRRVFWRDIRASESPRSA